MKKLVIFAIIFGFILLVAGAAVAAIGYKYYRVDKMVDNTIELTELYGNIDIKLKTTNIQLIKSAEPMTKLVIKETKKVIHSAEVSDNTLKITVDDQRKWFEKIFNFNDYKIKVDAYIPEANFESLVINSETGDITIPADFTFEKANIKASTGNIHFSGNVSKDLEVKTSTGNINISDVKPQNLIAKASTGNIVLNKVEVEEKITINGSTGNATLNDSKSKDLSINLSTGNIKLINYVASNDMELIVSTGNIKFENSDANTIYAKASTGDIKGTLLTGKSFDAESDTGKVTVPVGSTGGLCKLRTDTGRILIELAE